MSFLLSAGGSSGGSTDGILRVDLAGGTIVVVGRVDTAGRPADVERTEGACSAWFRPN